MLACNCPHNSSYSEFQSWSSRQCLSDIKSENVCLPAEVSLFVDCAGAELNLELRDLLPIKVFRFGTFACFRPTVAMGRVMFRLV